ncbi:MAG TPA: hypothetical protein VJV22_11985 [Acidobacteriaceae bacterium]|nr:hypothetical protein [Acidobacteriaceae bacterium]
MKRNIAIALVGLASLITTGGAFAQNNSAQGYVPFAFSVSNTTLPAGHYRIASNSAQSVLIRNLDELKRAVFSPIAAPAQAQSGTCTMVFHKYGDRYFLRQVLCPSNAISVDLPATRREKHAQQLEARGPVDTSVLVAMR